MHGLKVVLQRHVDLSLQQLVIRILVPHVEKHVVALKEKLLRLLLEQEVMFFLRVDGTLTLVNLPLHARKLGLEDGVSVGLLLDLGLQIGKVSHDLVSQLLAVLHFLLKLLVLEDVTRSFLVEGLPGLTQS